MSYARFVKQTGGYNHIDSDTLKMCILGDFLGSDVGCDVAMFQHWADNDEYNGLSCNATALEKENNIILLTDMYSEEKYPTELKMTCEQFIKLLDDWFDAVCIKKTHEITIAETNGEFIFETKP